LLEFRFCVDFLVVVVVDVDVGERGAELLRFWRINDIGFDLPPLSLGEGEGEGDSIPRFSSDFALFL